MNPLNELKIGDPVAVEYGPVWKAKRKYELRTVSRFTPTLIITDDSSKFYKGSGERVGAPLGTEYKIVPMTAYIATEIARSNGIKFLEQMDWDLLSSESILKIIKIICCGSED